MSVVDIAGNLTNKAFRDDLSAVLQRATDAGVSAIIVAGVSTTTSQRGLEMALRHTGPLGLFATSGIHPHHASDATPEALRQIAELAGSVAGSISSISFASFRAAGS